MRLRSVTLKGDRWVTPQHYSICRKKLKLNGQQVPFGFIITGQKTIIFRYFGENGRDLSAEYHQRKGYSKKLAAAVARQDREGWR